MNFEECDVKQRKNIMGGLRKVWSRSPKRAAIINSSRHPTEKGPRGGTRYVCNICGKPFGSNDLEVDHVIEVIEVGRKSKDMSWDEIIARMFNSPKENLQAVCKTCHKAKTDRVNAERRKVKKV